MRKKLLINDGWSFEMPGKAAVTLDLPHTWNGTDGQDGGNDYLRTKCVYAKEFEHPELEKGGRCIIEFRGVNSECEVVFNGDSVLTHEGGYSTFYADVTGRLADKNILKVIVTNEKNDRVYPQKADFTFYGGIYRDVYMLLLPENRFGYGKYSSPCLKLKPTVEGSKGILSAETFVVGKGDVEISVFDGETLVAKGCGGQPLEIDGVHLWHGRKDPFLYTVKAELIVGGEVADSVTERVGFRTFNVDPDKGFFLNGKHYPLRGVCRHQDRPRLGNAIGKAEHDEDMSLIMDIGATTVRLAHYQHDQYFYDLCDEKGIVVWAEIPYISQHLPNANENAASQMRELINQNYNHASIICWGISNEITISRISQDTVDCHKKINDICHEEDPSRLTVVASYMAITKGNPTLHISDIVSYNLYFGWYLPLPGLTGWKLDGFHKKYPNTPLGLSEYGAEAMPNLHAKRPRRMDNTEDYQCVYHENILKVINARDYLWATHVWNMFDFAADARNQGGEPGMNHKGLVTFDRKLKKDSFYLYKAHWSDEKFVHIAGKRYANRTGKTTVIKVYSNCDSVQLYHNGNPLEWKNGSRIFEFEIEMQDKNEITAKSGSLSDSATIMKVAKPDPSYKLRKGKTTGTSKSWEK